MLLTSKWNSSVALFLSEKIVIISFQFGRRFLKARHHYCGLMHKKRKTHQCSQSPSFPPLPLSFSTSHLQISHPCRFSLYPSSHSKSQFDISGQSENERINETISVSGCTKKEKHISVLSHLRLHQLKNKHILRVENRFQELLLIFVRSTWQIEWLMHEFSQLLFFIAKYCWQNSIFPLTSCAHYAVLSHWFALIFLICFAK